MTRQDFIAWCLLAGADRSDTGVACWLRWGDSTRIDRLTVRVPYYAKEPIEVYIRGGKRYEYTTPEATMPYLSGKLHDF